MKKIKNIINRTKGHFICPFCFERHKMKDIVYRCVNDPQKCATVPDVEYGKFRGTPPINMGKVFAPPSGSLPGPIGRLFLRQGKVLCPHCHFETTKKVCPSCHSELPYTLGQFKDMIISVIGCKESGKSHYITVLIDLLKNKVGGAFNLSLQPVDDRTMKKYRARFYSHVYQKRRVIPATISARVDNSVRDPLVYTLSFMGNNILGRNKIKNVATVSFFDTAGEDLDASDTIRTENKYIFNSSGIIILIDPLQLPPVRSLLSLKEEEMPKINTETEDIISRAAQLIRESRGWPANKLIEIPAAVVVTKFDAIEKQLDASSLLRQPSNHNGFFDRYDCDSINNELDSCLSDWLGEGLIQQLRASFSHYSLFACSSLGCNPHSTRIIDRFRPHRVEDPFLWLLWRHGFIRTLKE